METESQSNKKKGLNRLNSNKSNMKRGTNSKLKCNKLTRAIKEAQKDSQFMKEIDRFIKATTRVYRLP